MKKINRELLELYLKALSNRAEVFALIGKNKLALVDYKKARLLSYNSTDLYYLIIGTAKVYSQGQSNFQEARKLLNTLLEKVKNNNQLTILHAQTLNALGDLDLNQGNYKSAMTFYNKAMKLYKKLNFQRGMGAIYNNFGIFHRNKGEYDKAFDYFNKYLKISEKLGDKKSIESAYGNIGTVFWYKGELKKALKYFQMDLKISQEIKYKYGSAIAHGNIGSLYADMQIKNDAISHLKSAIKLFEEVGNKHGTGIAMGNLGTIYQGMGNLAQAYKCYKKTMIIAKETEDNYGMGWAYGMIGEILLIKGDLKKAYGYTNKYLKINLKLEDFYNIGESYMSIGKILLEMDESDKALINFKKAQNIFQKHHVKFYLSPLNSYLSQLHIKKNNVKKAIEHGEIALKYSESSKNFNQRILALKTFGMANIHIPKKAMEFFNKAIALARKEKNIIELAKTLYEMAKIIKDNKKKIEILIEAKEIFEKMKIKLWIKRVMIDLEKIK